LISVEGRLDRARDEQGWDIHSIAEMQDLVDFAQAFSRRRYGGTAAVRARAA
jgi:hypothetical protein